MAEFGLVGKEPITSQTPDSPLGGIPAHLFRLCPDTSYFTRRGA